MGIIDNLYVQIMCKLKHRVCALRERGDNIESFAKTFMEDIIKRIDFFLGHNEIDELEIGLLQELKKMSKNVFVKAKDRNIYLTKLQYNIDCLSWFNLKHKINSSKRFYTVGQREIFYAELGQNVGHEQNGRRPVMILQSNLRNRASSMTIVVPITTHQKSVAKYDPEKSAYFIERKKDGVTEKKYLGSHEIPLILEGDNSSLYGFVNAAQIRAIDRKRISGAKRGVATPECYRQVIRVINNILSE